MNHSYQAIRLAVGDLTCDWERTALARKRSFGSGVGIESEAMASYAREVKFIDIL